MVCNSRSLSLSVVHFPQQEACFKLPPNEARPLQCAVRDQRKIRYVVHLLPSLERNHLYRIRRKGKKKKAVKMEEQSKMGGTKLHLPACSTLIRVLYISARA